MDGSWDACLASPADFAVGGGGGRMTSSPTESLGSLIITRLSISSYGI